jgi:HlyD family secretion protein
MEVGIMKKIWKVLLIFSLIGLLSGCGPLNRIYQKFFPEKETYNGRLEAETTRISAQTTGIVNELYIDEGDTVEAKQVIAVVNAEKLAEQKKQVEADLALNKDLLAKTKKMLEAGAATIQQRDELATRVAVLASQKKSIDLQLGDASIKSPISGIVLNKFVNKGEFVVPGTPIAEVADLSVLEALIYLPLNKLPSIKIGQGVSVLVEGLSGSIPAKITWIASESEFTPKTILTKETRTTLVYAVKLKVQNKNGSLKIGMPIDVEIKG